MEQFGHSIPWSWIKRRYRPCLLFPANATGSPPSPKLFGIRKVEDKPFLTMREKQEATEKTAIIEKQKPYRGNHFWAQGYCVDTVGHDREKSTLSSMGINSRIDLNVFRKYRYFKGDPIFF
jgi:hypothetical protein